jgi:hypothetical protein
VIRVYPRRSAAKNKKGDSSESPFLATENWLLSYCFGVPVVAGFLGAEGVVLAGALVAPGRPADGAFATGAATPDCAL